MLKRYAANVIQHDPYLAPGDLGALLQQADAVLLCTNHEAYQSLDPALLAAAGPTLVADIWNVFGTGQVFFQLPLEAEH